MDAGTLLLLAFVLACPLIMLWMHGRGRHAHGAGHGHGAQDERVPSQATLEELRQFRADIDARIAEFDDSEADEPQRNAA